MVPTELAMPPLGVPRVSWKTALCSKCAELPSQLSAPVAVSVRSTVPVELGGVGRPPAIPPPCPSCGGGGRCPSEGPCPSPGGGPMPGGPIPPSCLPPGGGPIWQRVHSKCAEEGTVLPHT